MRPGPARIARALGWIAVAAALALLSPGVRVVRADDSRPVSELPAGPACGDTSLGTAVVSVALPSPQEVERRHREQARPEVIPLDGGGNRYGGPDDPTAPDDGAE